jgi:hypothetical protein
MLVLPEEAVPQISVRQPRAQPPVNESNCGMPLAAMAGAGRTSSRDAGTTAASLEAAPTVANISAALVTGFLGGSSANSSEQIGEDGGEKIKGRLVAAAEKNGEADIIYSQFSGNSGSIIPGDISLKDFRFLFATRSMRFWLRVVNRSFPNFALLLNGCF